MTTEIVNYVQLRVQSWPDLLALISRMQGWLFRGQRSAQWNLKTALERVASKYRCRTDIWHEHEEAILNDFKRQSHQFIQHLPAAKDHLEWLSLIQHHGGPTRLLDFTRSFYIAAFFAMEDAEEDAAVWAVNQVRLDNELMHSADAIEYSDHEPSVRKLATDCANRCIYPTVPTVDKLSIEEYHEENPDQYGPDPIVDNPNVLAVKPWRLNQRMIVQQGWFLFPTSLGNHFEKNLCGAFGIPADELPETPPAMSTQQLHIKLQTQPYSISIVKFVLPLSIHFDGMQDLQRMNVTAATLFPGLDGFARSLHFHVRTRNDCD